MPEWNYGNAYMDYPISEGTAVFEDGSKLRTHDIFNELPLFMHGADAIFCDPPWNNGNLTSFYTKADELLLNNYESFYSTLFKRISEISPRVCYVEVGKEHLADFVICMRKLFRYVTFYNSTYYHRKSSLCYVVRGSFSARKPCLDYMDEEDIIKWVCQHEEYSCIGDMCMGRGLVAINAFTAGKRFVGTELNHKRLSVALKGLTLLGAKYSVK